MIDECYVPVVTIAWPGATSLKADAIGATSRLPNLPGRGMTDFWPLSDERVGSYVRPLPVGTVDR